LDRKELSYEEILEIVKSFESSSEFSDFHLKHGDTEIDLRKHGAAGPAWGESRAPAIVNTPDAPPPLKALAAQVEIARPVAVPEAPVTASSKAFLIKSGTVGTFYCAPEPGAAPFVTVGQRVLPNTTVCIVEVMKLMNSIQASCSGVVSQILVKDGEAVELGQTLMLIDRD